ncbi:MAG: helix-turn-helix domain-containing protein, partial [Gemmatimonadaceae bacterium]|nr:helix-turn-helix domain-containing protein [Gloeobacterales cyanobacterium ES-bin-141]
MDPEIRKHLKWVELFRLTGSASLVCLRCGISPPTRLKWVRRYEQFGLEGLRPQSRRPKTSPHFKLTDEVLVWILELRNQRFGHRR